MKSIPNKLLISNLPMPMQSTNSLGLGMFSLILYDHSILSELDLVRICVHLLLFISSWAVCILDSEARNNKTLPFSKGKNVFLLSMVRANIVVVG